MNPIKYIFVHHTAVSYDANPNQFEQTNAYHRDDRQFPISSMGFYVGYNYEIAKDGTVRQARKDGEETAAVKGYNFCSISICLDGNFDIELPTPMQVMALKSLLKQKAAQYSVPLENILPHRHFASKSCYGSRLADNWAQSLVGSIPSPSFVDSIIAIFRKLGISGSTKISLSPVGHEPDDKSHLEAE